MPRAALVLLVILTPLPAHAAVAPPAEQWVAVVAPGLRPAVEPLARHRRDQGMRVAVIEMGEPRKTLAQVHALCRAHPGTSHVLLVGAIEAARPYVVVPAFPGTISRMKGEPSDNVYGCPNGGRLPSVAVGRFPARSLDEARAMVAKTLALERAADMPGAWKRRLTVLAGIPAFNPVVDRLVEGIAMARFDRINPAWTGRAIYTNPLSRFCVPDPLLRTQALSYLREGQAVTLYLGHSNAEGLYGGPSAAFLDRDDWARLSIPHGGGVFVSFGCNGCQLRGRDGEGYGVYAIRNPRGPAAVVGSHGICFAAMAQLAADGMFQKAFQSAGTPGRLGACWLALLDGLASGKMDYLTFRMLDAVDGDSRISQAVQRQEHLEMFVLLGDPALRLPWVSPAIRLDEAPALRPGNTLLLRGTLPDDLRDAAVTLTLERSAASVPAGLAPVPREPGAARNRVLLANHEKANRFVLAEASATAQGTRFALSLPIPASLPVTVPILRVRAVSKSGEAMVTRRVEARVPSP
jgi:hypothetical protein